MNEEINMMKEKIEEQRNIIFELRQKLIDIRKVLDRENIEIIEKISDIKKDCSKSPDGYHAIFSPENMTGCCIYCGKPIA